MVTRKERVVLELEDRFTTRMAKAAAATKLLERSLGDLDGTTTSAGRGFNDLDRDTDRLGGTLRRNGAEIDQFSGRLRLMRDAGITLGPALAPLGAVAIPGILGLAGALGSAGVATGVVVAGFQGVGEALDAVNAYQLEPTAANLEAMQAAMERLSPAARAIVRDLDRLGPALTQLRDASAGGLDDGVARSVDNLLVLLPRLRGLFEQTADAAGDLAAESTESFTTDRWQPFLAFLEREIPGAITGLGRATGDLTHGLAELWMAFDPLNDRVIGVLARGADAFDRWASSLDGSAGFREFVNYVVATGPQVGQTLSSIGDALVQVTQAVAPLGGPSLRVLEVFADTVGVIAGSNIGTPLLAGIAAMTALSRATAAYGAVAGSTWGGRLTAGVRNYATALTTVTTAQQRATMGATQLARTEAARTRTLAVGAGKAGAALSGLGIAASGMAGDFALSNTAMLGLAGTLGGPWGAAAGAGVGLMLDLAAGQAEAAGRAAEFNSTLDQQTGALTQSSREWAVHELAQSGALEAARTVGLDLAVFREAALGNAGALQLVNAQLDAMTINQGNLEFGGVGDRFSSEVERIRGSLGETNAAVKAGNEDWQLYGAAMQGAGDAGQEGGSKAAAGATEAERATARAAASTKAWTSALEQFNAVLTGRASLRDYQAALDDFAATVKQNGRSLDITKDKGRQVQAALDGIATTALRAADGLDAADRPAFLRGARADFVQSARSLGLTAEQARRLANELGLLAQQKPKPKVDLDLAPFRNGLNAAMGGLFNLNRQKPTPTANLNDNPFASAYRSVTSRLATLDGRNVTPTVSLNDLASAKIAGINAQLASIDTNKTVYVNVVRVPSASGFGPQVGSAEGNLFPSVRSFSMGDVANAHQPQIAPAGTWRVWAEDETGGEAYIPLANDHRRSRAEGILGQVADRFGMRLERYAMGGETRVQAMQRQYTQQAQIRQDPTRGRAERPVVVAAPSLEGVRVEGRIVSDPRTGEQWIRGVIRDENSKRERFEHAMRGGRS